MCNLGIAYTSQDAWRRSIHSTQMLRVMPETRGRDTGSDVGPDLSRPHKQRFWRAGCAERCTSGSEGHSRDPIYRVLRVKTLHYPPYSLGSGFKSLAAHLKKLLSPERSFFLLFGPSLPASKEITIAIHRSFAQDSSLICHPERSEGSFAD